MKPEGLRYAVIRGENFALQALRRGDPALAGQPLAWTTRAGREEVIAEVSAEAAGIAPGLPVELALARCPGLLLRARDPAQEVEAQRMLLAAAFALSPCVESTAAGCATIDLQGADAERLPGALRRQAAELAGLGLPVRMGVGATPWLASLASRALASSSSLVCPAGSACPPYLDPVCIVEDIKAFLAPLPLAWAEPTPAQAELLVRWGLRTFGELTAIPSAEISRRWGAEGEAIWARAAGETLRVLRPVAPARTFAAAWDYDPPVESVEPLLFRLRRFAERIALELRGAGLVAERLALTLRLEDDAEHRREFRLPEPSGDVESWLRVLHSHLETVRTAARVAGVRLVATPARPALKQDGLFDTGLADPHAFWENLARLGALVGSERVGTPVAGASHRPDTFTLEKPVESIPPAEPPPVHPPRGLTLRRFRPAYPVLVATCSGRPTALAEPFPGEVCAARGPWRLSGEWWQPGSWEVEIWQVGLAGGGIYQLAQGEGGWRVEGVLD